jgi:hypothetical protein
MQDCGLCVLLSVEPSSSIGISQQVSEAERHYDGNHVVMMVTV